MMTRIARSPGSFPEASILAVHPSISGVIFTATTRPFRSLGGWDCGCEHVEMGQPKVYVTTDYRETMPESFSVDELLAADKSGPVNALRFITKNSVGIVFHSGGFRRLTRVGSPRLRSTATIHSAQAANTSLKAGQGACKIHPPQTDGSPYNFPLPFAVPPDVASLGRLLQWLQYLRHDRVVAEADVLSELHGGL
jgi:hypothetical protein